jgi:hypothetical protein
MEVIASNCNNLKYFSCRNKSYNAGLGGVSGDRVVAIVRACRHLETLELHNCGLVKQSHLTEIAELVANNLETMHCATLLLLIPVRLKWIHLMFVRFFLSTPFSMYASRLLVRGWERGSCSGESTIGCG